MARGSREWSKGDRFPIRGRRLLKVPRSGATVGKRISVIGQKRGGVVVHSAWEKRKNRRYL